MDFLNEEIDLATLPRAENINFNPAAPQYYHILRIGWLISSIVLVMVLVAVFVFIPFLQSTLWITVAASCIIVITVIHFISTKKSYQNLGFAIREHDITCRSGWFVTRIRTTPFNRIQHSNVMVGPLERRYGLATLVLYTAGSDDADLHVRGLRQEEAYRLKDWITEKVLHEQ